MDKFIVTDKAMRPASKAMGVEGQCFYCQEKIGMSHKDNCVLISKKIKIKMTIEYEVKVPSHWDKGNIEFHRNEGSWCSDHGIEELQRLAEEKGCLCSTNVFYEYIKDSGEPYLDEK